MDICELTLCLEDAMNEVGWCYLEGFGCKKDKVSNHSLLLGVTGHLAASEHDITPCKLP